MAAVKCINIYTKWYATYESIMSFQVQCCHEIPCSRLKKTLWWSGLWGLWNCCWWSVTQRSQLQWLTKQALKAKTHTQFTGARLPMHHLILPEQLCFRPHSRCGGHSNVLVSQGCHNPAPSTTNKVT